MFIQFCIHYLWICAHWVRMRFAFHVYSCLSVHTHTNTCMQLFHWHTNHSCRMKYGVSTINPGRLLLFVHAARAAVCCCVCMDKTDKMRSGKTWPAALCGAEWFLSGERIPNFCQQSVGSCIMRFRVCVWALEANYFDSCSSMPEYYCVSVC